LFWVYAVKNIKLYCLSLSISQLERRMGKTEAWGREKQAVSTLDFPKQNEVHSTLLTFLPIH